MKYHTKLLLPLLATATAICSINSTQADEEYYTGEQVFALRPKPIASKELDHIGPTGILAYIEKGVQVIVTGTQEGSPAAGKFQAGEVILGVNGNLLKGLNPYEVLGSAITNAESGDGKLTFDLESKGKQRAVTIQIPQLGTYSDTWPSNCPKSKEIIKQASAFYSKAVSESTDAGIPTALPCLFLLSTGDDAYLPVIKGHLRKFFDNPNGIGENTWNNGYNGILIAEYYLRTGDKEALPALQVICDDARDRQNYDSAWKHWGSDINPSYVGGGLMNPASTQVLTTLLLCKEIEGVNVDDKTLINALRYFWRFVGHGSVPYGDHRAEGGVASNGKDAMLAAAMQVASGAAGDTSIYKSARDYLSMATLEAYPDMIMGHADNGRGDGIWRGIASSYLMEKDSKYYREVMDKIIWWYDLSRYHNGAMGLASCEKFNDSGSGAGAAMTFTAPLKTLRITGAARSKFAQEFKLPERIWGNETDLAFHSIKPVDGYDKYGKPMAINQIEALIGSSFRDGAIAEDPNAISVEQLKHLVRHRNYKVRAQAAKALRIKGEVKVLEELLQEPDPRLRRAALDGINDWRFFFGQGKEPLASDLCTPKMIESITAMLTNPKESIYVVEGALFANGAMPAEVVEKNLQVILPWSKHQDWWFRHASFTAIQGMVNDPVRYIKVVPILTKIMTAEDHTAPRTSMNSGLASTLKKYKTKSEIGKLITKGFNDATSETHVIEGRRGREGKYNISHAIWNAISVAPETAPQLASMLADRGLSDLDDDELLQVVSGRRSIKGLTYILTKLKGAPRKELENVLYEKYKPELIKRLKASDGKDMKMIDAVLEVSQLRDEDASWKPIGSPKVAERIWQFTDFEPTAEKDILPKREGRRYRMVDLPANIKDWYKPEYDASDAKVWQTGTAPIGKGGHPRGPKIPVSYPSAWGDDEILLARTTFEVDHIDFDMYRLKTLCNNGFVVYLNGEEVQKYTWWKDQGEYAKWPMGKKEVALLKKGINTISVYAIAMYPYAVKTNWKQKVFGECDVYIEGLRIEDLYK